MKFRRCKDKGDSLSKVELDNDIEEVLEALHGLKLTVSAPG